MAPDVAPVSDPAAAPPGVPTPQPTRASRADAAAITALYLLTVLVYALLGHHQSLPLITPDEFTYGHLAQSFADGHGFSWRGEDVPLRSALYIYAIAPAWLLHSTVAAYSATKLIGAFMVSSVVFPVWLLARQLVDRRLALLLAAVMAGGTWMITAASVVTENLAFPLSTWCLVATVMALLRPGSRWSWLALIFCAFAAWSRFQLILLLPILLIAFGIDVLRAGDERPERVRQHRVPLVASAVVLSILAVVAIADFALLTGSYAGATHFSPSISVAVAAIGKAWLGLFAMAGFLPIIVMAGVASSRRAWRDRVIGSLLAVGVPSVVLFVLVSGWSTAGFKVPWHIQRYVEYVVPLTVVLLAVAAQRPSIIPRRTWAIALVLGLGCLLGPQAEAGEGRAYYAVAQAGDALLGASASTSVTIAALLIGLGGLTLILALPNAPAARPATYAAFAAVLLTFVVVTAQSPPNWHWQFGKANEWRSGFPHDLRALDHAANGPVARFFVTTSHPRFETVDFFNKDVTQAFTPSGPVENGRGLHGKRCTWSVSGAGALTFEPGCGAAPRRLYMDDPSAVMTFDGQRIERRLPGLGRIVSVPEPLKARAIAVLPCDDRTLVLPSGKVLGFAPRVCRSAFTTLLWLDHATTLAVRIRGGTADHSAQVGKQAFRLPAGKVTTIKVQVPSGQSRLDMRFDTQELPAGLPDVVGATLLTAGRSASIL